MIIYIGIIVIIIIIININNIMIINIICFFISPPSHISVYPQTHSVIATLSPRPIGIVKTHRFTQIPKKEEKKIPKAETVDLP